MNYANFFKKQIPESIIISCISTELILFITKQHNIKNAIFVFIGAMIGSTFVALTSKYRI